VASQRAAGDKLEGVAIDGVPVEVGGEAKGAVIAAGRSSTTHKNQSREIQFIPISESIYPNS